MANEGIEVGIYDHNNPLELKGTLEGRKDPTYLDEVKGLGGGSFGISDYDEKIIETPTLLDYRNVVRYKIDGQHVGGFIIRTKEGIIIDTDGTHGTKVAGNGFLDWLNDAAVQPVGGLKKKSPKTRSFSFASPEGEWYNSGDWVNPYVVGTIHQVPVWALQPTKWPEANKTAKWLWAQTYTGSAPEGTCYFRHVFNITTEGDYSIYVAGDDYIDVYIDGAQVVASDYSTSAVSEATKIDVHFLPGEHIVGIKCINTAGAAGIVEAIYLKGADDDITLVTSSATTSEWKALAYPTRAPGWSPGEIMITLMDEAQDRGVLFPTWMACNFTSTEDSIGQDWGDTLDWTFNIGESYFSILSKITELGVEAWVDPENFDLNIAVVRGEYRAEDPNAIVFELGKNIRKATSAGVGKIKNSLSVLTADGWLLDDTEESGSVGIYGVLEGTLEANVSTDIAKALVDAVFAQKATPEEGASYEIVDIDEPPFDLTGNWVIAPNEKRLKVPRRIVSVSVAEGPSGNPLYTLEFDTVFTSNEERINKVLNKQSGSGLGSGYSTASGTPIFGTPIVVTPGSPNAKIPKAPVGLVATSVGYWSLDGVNAFSAVTLNWDDVIENTDETETVVAGYEIWGHQTEASADNGFQFLSNVSVSEIELRGVPTEVEWEFKVRAYSDSGKLSAFSTPVLHLAEGPTVAMDAPDTPTLASDKGLLTATWTGELSSEEPPRQFRYVYAEVAPDVAGSPGTFTRMGPALSRDGRNITIAGLVVGDKYWVHLIAVDGAGIASTASPNASIILVGIELGDLDESIQDAIDAAHEAAINARQSTNLLEDNSFESNTEEFWDLAASDVTNVTTDPRTGLRHIRIEATGSPFEAFSYIRAIHCDPGDTFHFRLYVKNEVLAADPTDDDGLELIIKYGATEASTPTSEIIGSSQELTTGDYEVLSGVWTAPADTYFFRPALQVTETTSGIVYYIDDARLFLMVGETLIVDGSIVAEKLAANSVVASKIAAESIAAVHIQAEAVTAEKLAADSVTANKIAARAITADAIDVGAVQTSHIAAEVGSELNISSNTSIQLVAGQIDGVQSNLDDTNSNLETMQTYYTFGVDGAVVSTPSSPFAVAIRNDRIEMLENGNAVSYWNSGQMYVSQFIGERVILGNHQLEKYSTGTVVRSI